MKKFFVFAVLPLLIAAGCTTQYQASAPYDDVYYSPGDVPATSNTKVVVKQSQVPVTSDNTNANTQEANDQSAYAGEYTDYSDQPAKSATESYTAPGGDTYINNNYYDDYYDYAYASRLRRFHNNFYFPSYYDDYYTNMYWYDYNPWSWGTSIYFNSGWFGPSFGMSFGWGWPSYSYGWGGYPSYGGYWHGYNDGYYNGFYNGYYGGVYHNGWYNNEGGWYNNNSNYYYGHRSQSGFAGGSSNGRNVAQPDNLIQGRTLKSSGDLNAGTTNGRISNSNVVRGGAAVNARNANPADVNSRLQPTVTGRATQGNTISTSPQKKPGVKQAVVTGRGRYVAPSQNREIITQPGRNTQGRQVTPQTRYAYPQNTGREINNAQPRGNVYRENTPRQATQPARTFTQPAGRIQPYSAPSYSKPRSSQEYTTPKYRDMRNNDNYNQPQQRSGSNQNRRDNGAVRESVPQRPSNQSSRESQPARSTYSAPSRSNDNSNAAPSRSSSNDNSYSAPSRSSSSSSSSGSSSRSSDSRNGRR